eukprot:5972265-Pleurochrysis_carterae.AAC.2
MQCTTANNNTLHLRFTSTLSHLRFTSNSKEKKSNSTVPGSTAWTHEVHGQESSRCLSQQESEHTATTTKISAILQNIRSNTVMESVRESAKLRSTLRNSAKKVGQNLKQPAPRTIKEWPNLPASPQSRAALACRAACAAGRLERCSAAR